MRLRLPFRWLFVAMSCSASPLSTQAAPPAPALTTSPAPRTPRRLALLVGIGSYYQHGAKEPHKAWGPLHVEQEIQQYAEVLRRHYGFARQDIRTLLDQQAGKKAITDAFAQLIEAAQPGDIVVFHFSGHGQRLPDDAVDPDEPDGLDESLVTYDATDQSIATGAKANIRDDELANWLRQLADRMRPAPGQPVQGSITVTLDSCFSGSATRGCWTARGRDWDPLLDGPLPQPRGNGKSPPAPSSGHPLSTEEEKGKLEGVSILAAARADQVAWEHQGQGAFTAAWVEFLAQSYRSQSTTYHLAAQQLAIRLHAAGANQDPQAVGERNRGIFSSRDQGHAPPDLILSRDGKNNLWLPVGTVHGVTLGSRYRLYAAGTANRAPADAQADAEVKEVLPFSARLQTSDARQIPGSAALVATEYHHAFALAPLRVMLDNFDSQPLLQQWAQRVAEAQIVSPGIGQTAAALDYDLRLRYDQGASQLQVFRPTESTPHDQVRLAGLDPPDAQRALAAMLLREWRWRHFVKLRNEDASSCIVATIVPTASAAAAPQPASHVRLAKGDKFTVRLHNRSTKPLYAAVLGLSPDGDIDVLVGNQPGKNRIEPGATWGTDAFQWELTGKPGERVLLKVIATDQFVDFMPVESIRPQPATRGAAPLPPPLSDNPLLRLLQSLQTGQPTTTLRSSGPLAPSQWGTTEGSIVVR